MRDEHGNVEEQGTFVDGAGTVKRSDGMQGRRGGDEIWALGHCCTKPDDRLAADDD